jgi:predicted dehydrogenase
MMSTSSIRIGIVGLGANTRLRHVPGLRACPQVEIVGVCNRSWQSSQAAAEEFGIPKVYSAWSELVADSELDAVVIGTWPAMHCEITLASLAAGKHVLTEARMARNAEEARQMLAASFKRPELVAQIVPSPFGLTVHRQLAKLMREKYLGQLQEIAVLGVTDMFADPAAPRHWRQATRDSGLNVLTLGILHETLIRHVPDPTRVFAQGSIFTTTRADRETGAVVPVDVPDTLQVLAELPDGVRSVYHLSGVANFGPGLQIHFYGSEGTIKLIGSNPEELFVGRRGDSQLRKAEIADELKSGWRVEAEFINAIRGQEKVQFTDFATGLRYMRFTQAVADSLRSRLPVEVPQE